MYSITQSQTHPPPTCVASSMNVPLVQTIIYKTDLPANVAVVVLVVVVIVVVVVLEIDVTEVVEVVVVEVEVVVVVVVAVAEVVVTVAVVSTILSVNNFDSFSYCGDCY